MNRRRLLASLAACAAPVKSPPVETEKAIVMKVTLDGAELFRSFIEEIRRSGINEKLIADALPDGFK